MTEKPSIIVIDDDEEVRNTLCAALDSFGFGEVPWAGSGVGGLFYLRNCPGIRLVITDIIMPDKEGIETILEIKRDYPHIRIIAISGSCHGMAFDFLTMAEKLGADAILSKPIDLDKLEKTIRELLAA